MKAKVLEKEKIMVLSAEVVVLKRELKVDKKCGRQTIECQQGK